MIFIARYHHLTWELRKKQQLPELVDHNDLPERRASQVEIDDAIDKEEMGEYSVLKPIQQKRLQYHQAKFSKAHTFYRPHETSTHHAFPLRLLIAVVVLLDCHSCLQVALGTCTWSWNYHTRPEALTSTILACSITCNIVAGVLISVGDHRTRKKDVLERINRQNLTEEALERMAKERKSTDLVRKQEEAKQANEQEAKERQQEESIEPAVMVQAPTNEGMKDDEKKGMYDGV
jgi:C4-dicarboxylate-specific signal transduction histidine kinase